MRKRLLLVVALVFLFATFGGFFRIQTARASWSQNNIIDDAVFDNAGTMSAGDIQNFLNGFPSSCLKNYQAPYPNTYNDYGGNVSAATVIRRAADFYGVNPQVILATLEKEESLVSGGAGCPEWRYNSAMGMGCPDGGACPAPGYEGFSRQVTKGTWLLKFAKERSNGNAAWNANDGVGGDSALGYYGPMTQGCKQRSLSSPTVCYDGYHTIDGATVHIDNGATGSFYNYTPHFHGNQNFVSIFESWFGSVRAIAFQWQYVGQSGPTSMTTGSKGTFTLTAKNTGGATWHNDGSYPVRLAPIGPAANLFCDTSWLEGCARAAVLNESSVAPGENGTFTFTGQAPPTGNQKAYFNLVAENYAWFNDVGQHYPINVSAPNYANTVTVNDIPTSTPVTPGAEAVPNVHISVRNDGDTTWYNTGRYPIKIGTFNPIDRSSTFAYGWTTRPALMNESSVAPGETATFNFNMYPSQAGVFEEGFSLVAENYTWFGQNIGKTINVTAPYVANTSSDQTLNVVAGEDVSATVSYQNVGTSTWSRTTNPLKLGTTSPQDRISAFCGSSWLGADCNRLALMNESTVAPGETATFNVTLHSQVGQSGTYVEKFIPVAEGLAWTSGKAVSLTVNVSPAVYSWEQIGQAAYTDNTKATSVNNFSAGQTAWLVVRAKNTGNKTWANSGANPTRLGTWGPMDRDSRFATDAWINPKRAATLSESTVAPGETGTFEFPIAVPAGGGHFSERFNVVTEGITWMNYTGLGFGITVNGGYSMSYDSQYALTEDKSTPIDLNNLTAGQKFVYGLKVKNTGNATWFKTGSFPARLGTSNPNDRTSTAYDARWVSPTRVTAMQEDKVAPGEIATFEGYFSAPSQSGTYKEYFNPVVENLLWLNNIGVHIPLTVH